MAHYGTKEYLTSLRPVARQIAQCPVLTAEIDISFTVPRTGLLDRGVPLAACETIGGHSSRLAYDVEIFPTKEFGLNKEEMWSGCAWHDAPVENPPGRDIGRHEGVSASVKDGLERKWLGEFLIRVGPAGAPIGEIWNSYQTGATPSMRMLKQLDKFRGGAVEPVTAQIDPEITSKEFFDNTRALVKHPFLKWGLNKYIDAIQSGSRADPEEIYHDLLKSHRDFEAKRNLRIVVSRQFDSSSIQLASYA